MEHGTEFRYADNYLLVMFLVIFVYAICPPICPTGALDNDLV
ncbi:MAG: hypothetical protein U5K00_08050 [Melioribacteraceae bacterium]|nr:hypothetical protein [Melioribacteraceae bacterium]